MGRRLRGDDVGGAEMLLIPALREGGGSDERRTAAFGGGFEETVFLRRTVRRKDIRFGAFFTCATTKAKQNQRYESPA